MLKERDAKRLKEMETAKAQLKAAREEVTAAEARSTAAAEESAASKKELLAASSDIESLKKHCTDLESRKRAPLYQKKQVCTACPFFMCMLFRVNVLADTAEI